MGAKAWHLAGLLSLLLLVPVGARAQAAAPAAASDGAGMRELQRLQETERHRREAQELHPDVRLQVPPASAVGPTGEVVAGAGRLPQDESPCFPVDRLAITGDARGEFGWLRAAADRSEDGWTDPAVPRCLGSRGIAALMARLQNALVGRGLLTSRLLIAPQDLKTGTLTLTLVPGRVHAVRVSPDSDPRAFLGNAMPLRPGDLLDLRAVEQGLENLRRLPSANAGIEILPAEARVGEAPPAAGESDLLVHWRQDRPLRGSLTVDDAGNRAHGQLQGSLSVTAEHLLGLNDLLQASVQHDLERRPDRQGLRGHSLQYALPLGNWSVSASGGEQRFYQQVAGSVRSYIYSGYSRNAELGLQRLLQRDATGKSRLSFTGWVRASGQFLDDTEIEIQRRRSAGWTLGLDRRQFLGPATLDMDLALRQGTGAARALVAPEEVAGSGVSRPRILNASAQLDWPLSLLDRRLRYAGAWRAQWSEDRLVPLDRFTVGGRYTVRGFDGETVLSGQRGWLLRNELGLALGETGQEVFLAVDHGRVSGYGTESLVGTRLTGAVLGWRGGLSQLRVEVFAGGPLSQPAGFNAPDRVAGFSLTRFF